MGRSDRRMHRNVWGIVLLTGVAAVMGAVAPARSMAAAQFEIDKSYLTSDLPNFLPASPGPPQADPATGPTNTQAGAYPAAGTFQNYSWTTVPATDDVKNATANFGPGVLANPQSRPQCSQTLLEAGGKGCPEGSLIGTSRFQIGLAGVGTTAASLRGLLYNSEPDPGKPGQLATITITNSGDFDGANPPPASSFTYLPIPFTLTPRGNGDYGLTGVTGDITRPQIPVAPGPPPVFVDGVATNLSFLADEGFTRNPTSCVENVTTSSAVGYDDPEVVNGPNYSFTPTGCAAVPFGPSAEVEVGDRGSVRTQKYPPLVVKIKNQNGHADIKGQTLLLPQELNTNNTAYKLCTQAQADANACPADSKFGWSKATSPFLNQQLQGPVYLVQQTSSSLPGLLIDLQGLAHVKIQTSTVLINNSRIQSVVTNAPQLPVSELTVALNGGKSTGVFQNRSSLCFEGDGTSKFKDLSAPATFAGWNGSNVSQDVNAVVNGCGPAVTGRITRATTSRPKLNLLGRKHPDATKIKGLRIRVPKTMRFVKKRVAQGAVGRTSPAARLAGSDNFSATSRTLTVKGLNKAGVDAVRTYVRKGAIRMTAKTLRSLRRGKDRRFRIRVTEVPVSGDPVATTATVRADGKRVRSRARSPRFTG